MQKTGGKQSTLKKMNRKLILNFVGEEKLSCADISSKSGLSYTGVLTVVDGLMEEGIVKKTDADTTSLGRRAIWVEMNRDFGMVGVVTFAGDLVIGFYALDGACLYSEKHDCLNNVCRADIEAIADRIDTICREKFPGVRLLHLGVAVPGKVEKDTGAFVFAPHFADYKNLNLKEIFGKRLNVSVTVKNDLRFSLYAEKTEGKLKDKICDTLFLQFGDGFGCALFLDDKLYEGGRGHGGEIGMFITDYTTGALFAGERNTFQSTCSYDRLVEAAKENKAFAESADGEITLETLVKEFDRGNFFVSRLVEEFADAVANVIKSLSVVIDFNTVLITKQSLAFGDRFLSMLVRKVNVGGAYSDIGIYSASLGGEGILLGAKKYAIRRAIEEIA